MEKLKRYFTSGLFLCLTISAIAVGQDFSATLNVAGGISGYDLTFGFNPDATDGYDEGIDSYAPPAPPPPAFDAALTWSGAERYYTQILAGDGDLSVHEYGIALAYGADNLITITWDNTGWSDMMSSCVLQDAFGGLLGIDIDMIQENSLTLTNTAFNTLKLLVTPTDYVEPPSTPSCVLGDVYVSEAANQGDPEDYIEIYNGGSVECSLAGFQIDDEQPFDDFTFGDVVLASGAFWLGYEDAGGSFSSGLGSGGDVVYFGDADGNVLSVTLEASVETVDGVQLSQSFDTGGTGCYTLPTPGETNADCFVFVYGCTNSDATNYNADANVDDGSCEYAPGDTSSVFITELADPNNESGARFVELFNISMEDVDLSSGWALQRWTNGNADPQDPVALTGTIPAGGFYVISPNGTAFESMYGVEADQDIDTGGAADSNGDDNIALVDPDGNIVDIYGRPGEDGTGTDHEFEDGRAERNSDVAGGITNFDPSEWVIDNDDGGGDGPQDAPDGFDPFVWFDHDGLPTGNWGCLNSEALNYNPDSDGCEDGTESCCDYPTLATISEIQGQADSSLVSPFAGEYVETSGIVTAVTSGSYWIQDGSGAWNGIYVYSLTDTLVSVGDDITIVALVTEYYDLTELTTLVEFTVNSSGNALPDAVSLATGAVSDEAYESVLVATSGTCDNADLGYGEWSIDDGSGPVRMDDVMYPDSTEFVPTQGNNYEVTGPLTYSFSNFKVLPRDENDVVDVTPDGGNPDFSVTINVAAGDSITYYDLTVGFSPDATDAFDLGIDSYAPPAPPPPAFDAALTWSGDRYYTQILNGSVDDLVEHEYGIALAYGTDNLIELSWDNTGWSDLMSACVLQDAFGGLLGIDIDMLTVTSLTLNDPAFNALKLMVTPAAGSDEPDTYPVTFTVADDGNDYQDVELKGSMTDWANLDMNNDGTGTWTLTLDLEAGSYEWGAIENDGSEWGIWLPSFAGFDSNPTVVVGPDGTVNGDVGFTVPFQGGDEVTVTFNVDMSNEEVSADGVHIAGTMNNWDVGPMSDDDGDGVYTASFSLVVGSTAEYKFLNGNAWGTEEIVPEECSLSGFGNRYVDVPASALVLDAVCFGGCGTCTLSVDESDILPEVFALRQNYPNPFNPVTTLRYNLSEQATVNIIIYDMLGRKITQLVSAKQEPGYRSVQWDATDSFGNPVSAGIYLYQIQAGKFVQTRKMVLLK